MTRDEENKMLQQQLKKVTRLAATPSIDASPIVLDDPLPTFPPVAKTPQPDRRDHEIERLRQEKQKLLQEVPSLSLCLGAQSVPQKRTTRTISSQNPKISQ